MTCLGIEQSKQLSVFLSSKNIQYIVSSPFTRAYDSVLPLGNKLQIEIMKDERLSERILSSTNHPDWLEMLKKTFVDLDVSYEGGESSRTAANRALNVIEDLLESKYETFAIATHGNLMSLILNYYDKQFHFEQWKALTNPDVFKIVFHENTPVIERIWIQ